MLAKRRLNARTKRSCANRPDDARLDGIPLLNQCDLFGWCADLSYTILDSLQTFGGYRLVTKCNTEELKSLLSIVLEVKVRK